MHLGQLIGHLRRETEAGLVLEALDDLVLFSEIVATGETFAESPAEYLAGAASRFANQASHEQWLQLVTAVERSSDTGRTLLIAVARWALAQDRPSSPDPQTQQSCSCSG